MRKRFEQLRRLCVHPAIGLLAFLVLTWFWPVRLVLGQRPLGNEIASHYLPLMSYYDAALKEGRVALWNERWGFGVPALAEGQMGVFYPPHLLLYGLLDVQDAYAASLLIHFAAAAFFAYLCGRGFQLSARASVLAAMVFVGQGFFVVQFCRPWSYTTGCWLPLAVCLTWRWLSLGGWASLLGLWAILGVQLLAGHFQLALYTHLVVAGICLGALIIGSGARLLILRRWALVLVVQGGALCLAAVQLVPTLELAMHADRRREGGAGTARGATPPSHLISYIAPTLLHRHPLWEPVAWMPWNASPAESLDYVGLFPLVLALAAVVAGRSRPVVRLWGAIVLLTTALSFGSQLPALGRFVELAPLDWFEAPARWSVVTGLFLALLAGWGIDRLPVGTIRQWCLWFAVGGIVVLLLLVLVLVAASEGKLVTSLAEGLETSQRVDVGSAVGRRLLVDGYQLGRVLRPSNELGAMLSDGLIRAGIGLTVLLLAGLIRPLTANKQRAAAVILAWSALDIGLVGHVLRGVDFQPKQPLGASSPVMRWVDAQGASRVLGPLDNLAMAVGAVPMGASARGLARLGDTTRRLAKQDVWFTDDDLEFVRLGDIRSFVRDPHARLAARRGILQQALETFDPWLDRQYLGAKASNATDSNWRVLELDPAVQSARAWSFPILDPPAAGTDPRAFRLPPPARMGMLENARAAAAVVVEAHRVTVSGTIETAAVLVLSDLHYPGWKAERSQGGTVAEAPIELAFGGWRAVHLPEPGPYTVTFSFQPRSFRAGWSISLGTLLLWLLSFVAVRMIGKERGAASPDRWWLLDEAATTTQG